MLVDDSDLTRQGVRSLIEDMPDWTICAEASDGAAALELAATARPDVVVIDVWSPRIDGVAVTEGLRRIRPDVEILALTTQAGEPMVARALKAGARGYVLKSESGAMLLEALSALSRHQTWFCSSVSEALLQSYLDAATGGRPANRLTPREQQVVKLVAEGHTNRQIAQALRLSLKTIESHRAAAMRKVGARSSADLTLYAIRSELVPA